MEPIDFTNIPYSQHHREAAMMLGSATIQSVFTYLLDEYLFRLRTGKSATFKVSCNHIEEMQGVYRKTVKKTLQQLEIMKLISVNGSNVTVNGDVYASLIFAFHNLPNVEEKKKFSESLQVGDFAPLEEMGYAYIGEKAPTLLNMTGGMFNIGEKAPTDMVKNDQFDENGEKAPIVLVKNNQLSKTRVGYKSPISQIVGAFSPTDCDEEELIGAFSPYLDLDPNSEEAKELLLVLFGKKSYVSEQTELVLFHQLTSKMLVILHQLVGEKAPTEINNNKTKKIKYHDSGKNIEQVDFSSFQDVSGCFDQDEPSDKNDDDLPDNLPKLRKREGIHYNKPSYPYFPASEVLEFINNIHLCLDNDIKLFLYHVNQEIHARYDQDEEYDDETGEVIKEASVIDTTQLVLRKSEVEDIASEAITNARNDIEDRDIFVNDEEVHITAEDNLDRLLKVNIIDWEFQLIGDGEKACQIDWGRIQNPDEEELQQVRGVTRKSRRTKVGEVNPEREDNKRYVSAIIDGASEDETWDKMSPMEKLIYNFLCDYFVFQDDCNEVKDIGDLKYLNRNVLLQFFLKEKQKYPDTPSKEEFFSTFNIDKPDTYGGISLRSKMFSAERIRYWNKKHGYKSLI